MGVDVTWDVYNIAWAGDRISSAPFVGEFLASYGIKAACEDLWGKTAETISSTTWSLKDLQDLGHPYAKRPIGSTTRWNPNPKAPIPEPVSWIVHQQSGDMIKSLHWKVGFKNTGGVYGMVGHWVETGASGASIIGTKLIGDEIENADVDTQKRGVEHAINVVYGTKKMIARPYLKELLFLRLENMNRTMEREIKGRSHLSQLYSITRRANTLAKYVGIRLPAINFMYGLAGKWRTLETLSTFSPIHIGHRFAVLAVVGPTLGRAQSALVPFGGPIGSRASRFVNVQIGRSGIPSRIFGFASPHGIVRKKIPSGYDIWENYL